MAPEQCDQVHAQCTHFTASFAALFQRLRATCSQRCSVCGLCLTNASVSCTSLCLVDGVSCDSMHLSTSVVCMLLHSTEFGILPGLTLFSAWQRRRGKALCSCNEACAAGVASFGPVRLHCRVPVYLVSGHTSSPDYSRLLQVLMF